MEADETEKAHEKLFSWGANSYGQLGLSHKNDISLPCLIENINFKSSNFSKISAGGGHSAILFVNGDVLVSGSNDKGQLGLESKIQSIEIFQTITFMNKIKIIDISCGWDFTIAVSDSGDVYGWGSNAYGQLGNKYKDLYSITPIKINEFDGKHIIKIASGLRHTVAITTCNEIWAWGCCKKGQCGSTSLKRPAKTTVPVKIPLPKEYIFIDVQCGAYHSLVLSSNGDVFGWGNNQKGQLASDPAKNAVLVPILLTVPKLKNIASGWSHVVGITDSNSVISWGRGDYGQLGRNCPQYGWDYKPKQICIKSEVTQVCCGFEHSLAVTKDGSLLAWGWNEHGMCGIGSEVNMDFPTTVKFNEKVIIKLISCGSGYCFAN